MLHGRTRPFSRTRAGSTGPQYDFTTGSLPAGVTFTRASSAWGFNSAGVLTSYATNEPRFVYDPVTLANLGLLVEGARTNSQPNNTAAGAVAGTPGTAPNLTFLSPAANAITRTIVGTGVEDGIEYYDVQFAGTPSAGGSLIVNSVASGLTVAAANTQVWTMSCFVRVVAGSTTNLTSNLILHERDGAGAGLANTTVPFTPTTASLRTQRYTNTRTFNNASTAFVLNQTSFAYTLGNAIDITLRIGLPQLEQSGGATSPVKTSTVAVTRALDVALITDARALTDPVWVVKGRTQAWTDTASTFRMIVRDNGAPTDSLQLYRNATSGTLSMVTTAASVTQALLNSSAIAVSTDFAVATRSLANDFATSFNGAAVVTDAVGTLPATPTTFRVGGSSNPALAWNSTIKSIETRATASDADLQALSTP